MTTNLTTPKGKITGYCSIQKPSLNFNKDGEEYKVRIAFEPAELEPFADTLEEMLEAFFQETIKENPKLKKVLKKAPIGQEEFDDAGEETGRIIISLKQPALIEGVSKKSGKEYSIKKKIALRDSTGKSILKPLRIGAGSTIRASFEPNLYYSAKDKVVGMSFNRLLGVQLFDLVEFEGSGEMSNEDLGFENEGDGGFSVDDYVADEPEYDNDESPTEF